jgi:hypothetical protein
VDRIPLLIVPPAARPLAPSVVSTVGGQLDIGATVLHYLGVPAAPSMIGLPLRSGREGFVGRYDGGAADALRTLTRKRKDACAWIAPEGHDGEPDCKDLVERVEAQLEVSRHITLQDLAASLRVPPGA